MSRLTQLEQEYLDIVQRNTQTHAESAKKVTEYIKNSTAQYHGRCVRTLYLPKLFTSEEIVLFHDLIDVLFGIFGKVMKEYRENAEYRKQFGFDPRLEELILRKPLYDCPIPIARIDIFLNEETHEFKFCEFNTDGSSAMNEDRELNLAIQNTLAYQEFAEKNQVYTFELFDSWVEEFKNIYDTYQKKVENPFVAIVDFMESATDQEFKIFQKSFEKQGIRAGIYEIRDLQYRNGALFAPDGNKIDAIYRRAVTSDIMYHYEEVADFLHAVRDEAVCLIGDFRTQIAHNKILYKILYQEDTQALLTDKEVEYIRAHVPYTVSLNEGKVPYEEIIEQKDSWIIKPEDSYGSKGVHAGVECNKEEWKKFVDECMNQNYILQEFCKPFETENIDLIKDEHADFCKYSNLTGLFVYNGKFKGCYSRISQSEIISTQYSEMALPTVIVK